jgi:hypothetical protein
LDAISRLVSSSDFLDSVMPDRPEPLVYPSRHHYPFNPGITDRQLWAIGMVVVQWSLTEMAIDQQIRNLIGPDEGLTTEYARHRNFQSKMDFWETQIELKLEEPTRSQHVALARRVRDLNSQRDEVIHRAWGGGMQAGSWNAGNHDSTDAALLRKTGDKQRSNHGDGRDNLSWRLGFSRLRQMAREMSALNGELFMTAAFGS